MQCVLVYRALVHSVETVIIEWTHQIRDVLKKDSAQPLLEGLNPTPHVEIQFWKAKGQNLECIHDQVGTIILPLVASSSLEHSPVRKLQCNVVIFFAHHKIRELWSFKLDRFLFKTR